MSRLPLLAGNWKMYKTPRASAAFAADLRGRVGTVTGREVVLCPPFTSLAAVAEAVRGSALKLGAQNVHHEAEGAFTGEVAVGFLAELGCQYVIVGHSERRQYFGETDALIGAKLRAVLGAGLAPIFCLGEQLAEREAGRTFDVVRSQFDGALADVDSLDRVVIAYEPVWAIGTGRTATPAQAEEVHRFLRGLVQVHSGPAAAAGVRILYGGSVKPANIDELMREPDLDGALVGGASLDAGSFARIVQFQT